MPLVCQVAVLEQKEALLRKADAQVCRSSEGIQTAPTEKGFKQQQQQHLLAVERYMAVQCDLAMVSQEGLKAVLVKVGAAGRAYKLRAA